MQEYWLPFDSCSSSKLYLRFLYLLHPQTPKKLDKHLGICLSASLLWCFFSAITFSAPISASPINSYFPVHMVISGSSDPPRDTNPGFLLIVPMLSHSPLQLPSALLSLPRPSPFIPPDDNVCRSRGKATFFA